jgi:hypothetical protein
MVLDPSLSLSSASPFASFPLFLGEAEGEKPKGGYRVWRRLWGRSQAAF